MGPETTAELSASIYYAQANARRLRAIERDTELRLRQIVKQRMEAESRVASLLERQERSRYAVR